MNLVKVKNNNVITYTVNKVMNSNLYLSIQNGEVVVNAPWYATQSDILNIIETKREWIIKKYQNIKRK